MKSNIIQWWQTCTLYWKRGNVIELVVLSLSSIIIALRIDEFSQGKKSNFCLFWPIAALSFLGLTLNLLMLLSTWGHLAIYILMFKKQFIRVSGITDRHNACRNASSVVGVAVDDVAEIKEEATVNKLSMQLSSILIQGIICEKLMRNAKYKIIVDFAKDKSSTKIEDKNDQPKRINLYSNPSDEWEELLRKRDESTNRSMETRMTEMAAHLLEITRMLKASQAERSS
ncbi:unnamed protein product, partial [Mesorhabditis belari]|uniref:Uncharacterized protein n=1 Tax=Mesorhabditis belari TaxID=2138241 RepID=A0AAF3F9I7_9BILA